MKNFDTESAQLLKKLAKNTKFSSDELFNAFDFVQSTYNYLQKDALRYVLLAFKEVHDWVSRYDYLVKI